MDFFDAPRPLLPEILALHGKWRAQQDAAICGDTRLNWQQFVLANHCFANGLLAQGVKPGDKLAVLMSNGLPMLQAMMGAMAAGVVSVPINLSVNDDALISMLSDADAVGLVATSEQLARVQALADRLPASIELKIIDQPTTTSKLDDWLDIDALCAKQSTHQPTVNIADSDYLNVIYSSGTTGLPKGIVHNHAGRRDWAYDLAIALRYHGGSRTLLTLGLYSNISWVAMLTTLLAGGTLIIHKNFDAQRFLDTVAREAITHTAMVPVQFQNVIEQIDSNAGDLKLESMQAMMSCGSPLHATLKQKVFRHFPCGIIELYGLTEGVITTIEPEQSEGRWSSVGKPLIGTDIRILADDDQLLPAGESGEIVSRGRITMPGYLNREDANKEASYIDERGRMWVRTGDIGYIDDEGFLFIVDRKKDMILSGSQNIYPQDIEALLITHADISDVAVIAAPSEKWGETPIAIVVGKNIVTNEVMSWANGELGKQQRIADVIVIDEIPRNPNGKILKRELRVAFSEQRYA